MVLHAVQRITLLARGSSADVGGVVAVGGKALVAGAGADGGERLGANWHAALAQDWAGRHLHSSREQSLRDADVITLCRCHAVQVPLNGQADGHISGGL